MREAEDVADILRRIAPEREPERSFDIDWVLDPGLWNLAADVRKAELAQIDRQLDQVEKARQSLLAELRTGSITTIIRKVRGGEFTTVPPSAWNFEGYGRRFQTGRMKPESPFERSESGGDHFIYVSTAELSARFHVGERRFDVGPRLNELWPHLSPLMKVALRAADEIRIAGKQPARDDLINRFKQLAHEERADLSDDLAGRMVTVVRDEKARLGLKQK